MPGNPAFNESTFDQFRFDRSSVRSDVMTVQGTTMKGLLLLFLAVLTGSFAWEQVQRNPDLALPLLLGGAIGGFITAIITTFNPKAAPISGPIYALLEGLALGTISFVVGGRYQGLVMTAVLLTASLLAIMLVLYTTRVVRATPMLVKVVIGATGAIAITYFVSMVASVFGVHDLLGLNNSGPIGIAISLAIIGVACFNFILDFDLIERGAAQGAPKYMEWYSAFGVMVTLFWLYLEVLRLLAKLQNSNNR